MVAYVVDCPKHPRLRPLRFGFHEAAHATAFGKIMLSGMAIEQRDQYLDAHGVPRLTETTITGRAELDDHLAEVSNRGVAWERQEFVPGMTCAASGVRNAAGDIVGSVSVSIPSNEATPAREREIERHLRETANRTSRYYRSARTRVG